MKQHGVHSRDTENQGPTEDKVWQWHPTAVLGISLTVNEGFPNRARNEAFGHLPALQPISGRRSDDRPHFSLLFRRTYTFKFQPQLQLTPMPAQIGRYYRTFTLFNQRLCHLCCLSLCTFFSGRAGYSISIRLQQSPRLDPLTMPRQRLWCAFEQSPGGAFPIDYTDEDTYYDLKEKVREYRKIKHPITDLWTLYCPGRMVSNIDRFVPQESDLQVQPKSLITQSHDFSVDPNVDIIITMPHEPTFVSDDTSSDTLLDISKEYAETGVVVFPGHHVLVSFI